LAVTAHPRADDWSDRISRLAKAIGFAQAGAEFGVIGRSREILK
jgi:hypothetical protein